MSRCVILTVRDFAFYIDTVQHEILGKHISDVCIYLSDCIHIRLAVYEMKMDEDVPVSVAINEAVELAKRYGGEDSPSFVNGVLARIIK